MSHAHDDHSSPEYIAAQKRIFLWVLAALAVGTILTVWVAYIPFNAWGHITVALLIATVKASLVLLFFMHFISEKTTVYLFMFFTAFFVFGLFALSMWAWADPIWPSIYANETAAMAETAH